MGHLQYCIDRILSVRTVWASTCNWVLYFRPLCCLALLLIGGELRGQSLVVDFEIMGTKEGLPHENVSCMGLDSFGFLWVGTTGGIARFDGQAFDLVELDQSFSTHSQTRVVSALITDDDGIWIGTMGGLLAHYKLETQKWIYIDLPEISKSKPYKISCLSLVGETMFIGCIDGQVLAVNTADSNIYEYQMSSYPVIQIQSTIDSVWVSTVQQCFRAPTDNLNKVDTLPWGYVAMTRGAKLYKDQNKVKWTGRINGNVVFKEVGGRQFFTTHIHGAHDGFAAFSKDNIYAIDADGDIEEQFPITYNPALSLISTTNCALNTENGILWIGTDIGLIKVVKDRYHFKKYRMAGSPGSPPFSYVRTVHYFQNQLLGGSKFGGAFRLSFPVKQPVQFESINVYGAFGENYGTFNTFLNTKKGDVIAGAVDGLYTYHEDSVFRPLTAFDKLFDGVKPQVWSLLEDRFGRIWVGTLGMGLLIYEPETSQLIRIEKGGSEGLSSNSVWALTKGGDGCIWVGTSNGLDSVSYAETEIKCTPLSQIVEERIDGQEVWHVVPDGEDNLWIGTTDNGLSYFNRKERSIRNYHRADGLLNETVSGLVLQLDEKRLWISTQNGLFALNIERDEFHRLTVDDGLVSNEFNFKAITITETGEVFLGTKAGLMSFDPKVVLNDKTTYPLRISHLRVGNDVVNPHGILTLSPKLRQFSAKFSLLDYSAPEKHTFRYRLKPLEEDWTYTSNRERTATYTNLPPGEYELLVEGSVNEQWHTAGGTGLPVVVPSKLIEETWFRGLLLLLLLLAVTSIVRLRFVQLRDRARIQVKMAELERRMLTAQMSPHFLFNSMNAIQQFVLCNDSRSAQVYLSRFSSLIRMFLEASRNKLISLSDELRLLETYTELERIRFEDRFEVHFDIEQGLALDEIEIPTSLIQPFVENAILHGLAPKQEKGHLLVKMWEEQKVLWVWVDDDGVGRAVAEKNRNGLRHAPQGMKLVSELAKSYSLLDGFPETKIEVIDKTEKDGSTMGTRIVLKIDIC